MHFKAFYQLKKSPLNPPYLARSGCRLNRTDRRTSAEGGVRVSALLRRGAAPYADGCEQISGHSHLISLSILGVPEEFSPAFYATF